MQSLKVVPYPVRVFLAKAQHLLDLVYLVTRHPHLSYIGDGVPIHGANFHVSSPYHYRSQKKNNFREWISINRYATGAYPEPPKPWTKPTSLPLRRFKNLGDQPTQGSFLGANSIHGNHRGDFLDEETVFFSRQIVEDSVVDLMTSFHGGIVIASAQLLQLRICTAKRTTEGELTIIKVSAHLGVIVQQARPDDECRPSLQPLRPDIAQHYRILASIAGRG